MKRFLLLLLTLMAAAPAVQAEDLLDWLEEVGESHSGETERLEHDGAILLTLEPGESEMFPRVSPDGRHVLVISGKRNTRKVTLRLLENGDPVAEISEDSLALESMRWRGDDQVVFFSDRSGEPGLWQMPVGNRGPVRRLLRVNAGYVQPLLLSDDTLIAVRMKQVSKRPSHHQSNKIDFNNWSQKGKEPNILHLTQTGAEQVLSKGVNPTLSPDGTQIVFSMNERNAWHLYMMNTDGSDLIQLTNDHSVDVQPSWSHDGRWIAFASDRGNERAHGSSSHNWDIWAIRSDGRSLTRLTTNDAHDGAPSIAANGRVYFHSDRKVEKAAREQHQVSANVSGYHIWSVALPR